MNPQREWFCEYEKYNEGDIYLGNAYTRIIGHGRAKLLLKYGRIITLPGVLDILDLSKTLTFVGKMGDLGL